MVCHMLWGWMFVARQRCRCTVVWRRCLLFGATALSHIVPLTEPTSEESRHWRVDRAVLGSVTVCSAVSVAVLVCLHYTWQTLGRLGS
jgi:hypothetical protein